MSLIAPAALGLLALAVPLIVMYMLRSRRRGIEVTSTLLWEDEKEFVSAALPWQRLRITAALVLQLLALALFAILLARPFFRETTLLGPHTVLIVDTSGSMALAGRLDAAKAQMQSLVAEASEEQLVSIVEAGARPRVLAAFSRDPAQLAALVDGLQPGGGTEDLEGALRLARGLATPDRPTSLLFLSDGGPAQVLDEPVTDARHVLFDASGDNLAVTGLGTNPVGEGPARIFVEVASFSPRTEDVAVAMTVDGLDVGTLRLAVPPGERRREVLAVDAGPGQVVEAAIVGDADANPLDDAAAVVLTGTASLGREATTELDGRRRRGEGDPGDLFIVDQLSIGRRGEAATVTVAHDEHNGALYPFTLDQKLAQITEPSSWYLPDGDSPWGAPILPTEMISVLTHKRSAQLPTRGPAIGLFIDLEVRYVDGPVLAGRPYLVEHTVVGLGQSRRVESYWTESTVTDGDDGRHVATVLLHQGVFKASYAEYPADRL